MFEFMPPEVTFTLETPVREVVGKASEGGLTISLLVVLWSRAPAWKGFERLLTVRTGRGKRTVIGGFAGKVYYS